MHIRREFIRWPCPHGSMHLVTTTTVPPFHCPSVPPCRHVIRRPCHRATITPCHLPHHSTVPPATNMPQPCCRETWSDTVTPPCHRATSVPPGAPPYHRATWCATVPPGPLLCHRPAVPPPYRRQIGIPMYTDAPDSCQSYLLVLSDAISPYGLLLKIAMTTLLCFRRRTMEFPINI